MGIDTSLGLTQSQLKERKEALEYDARAISFGDAKAGNFLAIDANEEQSVTTLHTKRSQAMSIAEKTMGNTVFSIGTDFEYNSEDEDGSEEEKNSPRGQILFECLDLLNRTEETWKERNEESSGEQSKKTAKEDLEHKMERAQRENEMIDSENEEYQDARESDEDGDKEEGQGILANNQEELHNEADLLEWEIKQDKLKREKDMRKFRIVSAKSVQSQIFNEAGPHFKEMEWCSERAMSELREFIMAILGMTPGFQIPCYVCLQKRLRIRTTLNQTLTMRQCTTGWTKSARVMHSCTGKRRWRHTSQGTR